MNNLIYKRIKHSFFLFLIFLIFSCLAVSYFLEPAKFLILNTNTAYGTKIKYYNYLYKMHIDYSYEVDEKNYNGSTSVIYKSDFNREIYTIRYLIEKPSVSIVNDIILRETMIWFFPLISCFFGDIVLILAFIGKLPAKYQNNWDNHVSS